MIELSNYGEIIRLYKGSGQLEQLNNGSFDCSFEVAQFYDGAIRLKCEFSSENRPPLGVIGQLEGVISFIGTTEDNKRVHLEGDLLPTNSSISFRETTTYQLLCVLSGPSKLQVGEFLSATESEARFGLTNFLFLGTEVDQITWGQKQLALDLEGTQVVIRRVPEYETRKAAIEAAKGINVTCYAYLKLHNANEIEDMKEIVHRLCNLLSVARGTLVSWIYYDVLHPDGSFLYSEHFPLITLSYSWDCLFKDVQADDTKRFIEIAYGKYEELDRVYQLTRVVHLWASIRTSNFLEVSGLTLCSLLEYISGKFASLSGRATVIDENVFEQYQDEIESGVRQLLPTIIPNLSSNDAATMAAKSKGFNYRSLRSKLNKMLRHFEVPVSNVEIDDFVGTRNRLVHYAEFRTEDTYSEFRKMVHLVDRLLLKMLGYSGEYVNATTFERDNI